jgi:3-oxoacyl-[acyl-carrier-protein] synthase-3
MTKWLDWSRYSDSSSKVLGMLFGDGAGAVVLSRSGQAGYLTSKIVGKGEYWDTYGIYLGTASTLDINMIQEKRHFLRFHENQHRVPPDFNTSLWPTLIQETMEKVGHRVEELAMVFLNQVELNVAQETLKSLNLPLEKTHWIADKFGYAGSASALMALYDAIELGKIRSGDLIIFCTSGAGFVVSSALFKWI